MRDTQNRVMVCFGTRPEVIKLASVIDELRRHPQLDPHVVTTAQHREMLDQMLAVLDIRTDDDLDLMTPGQQLSSFAGAAMTRMGNTLRAARPAAVLVQGDTSTAVCCALAAFYEGIPVGHVEAGLRTWDRANPYPEEVNRRMIAQIASWHFCPTSASATNLIDEGCAAEDVYVTGNTVIDALWNMLASAGEDTPVGVRWGTHRPGRPPIRRVLVTMHRRETQGDQQRAILEMLRRVASREDVEIVLPVHRNPAVAASVREILAGQRGVQLVDPLDYRSFLLLMRDSDIVLTDSGGLQEEAAALGVPVLVMRDTTERPEGVDAGCAVLCGTSPESIEREVVQLLDDDAARAAMAAAPNPYGDGTAASRIVRALHDRIGATRPSRTPRKPPAFRLGAAHQNINLRTLT